MASTIEIFLCYAREDEAHLQRLEKQLRVFQREELIRVWHDRNISAGEEWEQQIHTHLNAAQIVLLLVSPDFIHSDYCWGIEMTEALKRHAEGEARVVPIIVRPVHWEKGPLGKLQALPTDGKPITSASWHTPDDAFHDVAEGVRKVIGEFLCIQWIKTGKEHLQKHQDEEALVAFAKAIDLAPHYEEAYHTQGDALYDLGHHQDALVSYGQVHSTERSIMLKRGQCWLRLRQYEDALAAYEEMIRLNGKDAQAHTYRGYTLFLLNRYEEAFAACEQALRLDSKSALAHYFSCSVLMNLQRHQQALSAYERASSLQFNDASTYLAKGDALAYLERYEEALAVYKQAQQLAPHDPWIYEHQGDALQQQKQYEKALAAYEQALHRDPGNTTLYHKKGVVLEQLMQQAYTTARKQGSEDGALLHPESSPTSQGVSLSSTLFDNLALIHTFQVPGHIAEWLAISPNGQFVAGMNDRYISIWDLRTRTLIGNSTLLQQSSHYYVDFDSFLSFDLDSSIIIAGMKSRKFTLWNPYTAGFLGTLSRRISEETPYVINMDQGDGKKFVGTLSHNTTSDGELYIPSSKYQNGTFNPDRKTFVGAYTNHISFWNLHDGVNTLDQLYAGHGYETTYLVFSPDGQMLVSGGAPGDIRIWDTHTMRASRTITGHKGAIRALIVSPDGETLISGSDDKTVKVWNIRSGKLLSTLEGHAQPIQVLLLSSDGQTLLSAGQDNTIGLWNLQQEKLLRMIILPQESQPSVIHSVMITADGKVLIGSIDKMTIKIWGNK